MKRVLDSSVAFKWVVPELHSDKALLLRDDYRNGVVQLVAPDIFLGEVTHALTRAERQKRITPTQGAQALADILSSSRSSQSRDTLTMGVRMNGNFVHEQREKLNSSAFFLRNHFDDNSTAARQADRRTMAERMGPEPATSAVTVLPMTQYKVETESSPGVRGSWGIRAHLL